jgi:hypothetical protein
MTGAIKRLGIKRGVLGKILQTLDLPGAVPRSRAACRSTWTARASTFGGKERSHGILGRQAAGFPSQVSQLCVGDSDRDRRAILPGNGGLFSRLSGAANFCVLSVDFVCASRGQIRSGSEGSEPGDVRDRVACDDGVGEAAGNVRGWNSGQRGKMNRPWDDWVGGWIEAELPEVIESPAVELAGGRASNGVPGAGIDGDDFAGNLKRDRC